MDMDGSWVRWIVDIAIAIPVAVGAAIVTLFGWRNADKKEIKSEIAKDQAGYVEDVDHISKDIEKIKDRLARGDNRMTRIEEQLKHIPTQKQYAVIDKKLAALGEAQKANGHITKLIHDHLLNKDKS